MDRKIVLLVYWSLLLLTILTLCLSFGLLLFGMFIFLLPMIIFHIRNGIKLSRTSRALKFAVFSAFNFLMFSFLRVDGVHVMNINGLNSLLEFLSLNRVFSYHQINGTILLSTSLILFVIQIVLEIWILKKDGLTA